jgi:O-methyltransferase domain
MGFKTIQVLWANCQTLHLGALIYYLRHIIHDYQDSVCINILKHLADALPENEPRAKVLICEQIMSATPSPVTTAMDMAMVNIGAKERTEAAFERIVTAAGLRFVKCHRQLGHDIGIVECSKQLG